MSAPTEQAYLDRITVLPVVGAGYRLDPPRLDEKYALGTIVTTQSVRPDEVGVSAELAPAGVHSVEVSDPYVDCYDPGLLADVRTGEQELSAFAAARHRDGIWHRRPETVYFDGDESQVMKRSWGDPMSQRMFLDGLRSPAFEAWTTLIPSAQALTYLAGPDVASAIAGSDGTVVLDVDERARMSWSLSTDGVAVRSRASVLAHAVTEHARQLPQSAIPERWVSVACGTALPSMKAALFAGVSPELLLVDLDVAAMESTSRLALEIGYSGAIAQHRVNIFAPQALARLGERLHATGGRPQFVDLMGIFEYTGAHIGVDATRFLRSSYDLLAPGGRLVFGQMRSDRPIASLFTGVIGWPFVQMRTVAEFLAIIRDAEIPLQATQLYLPTDGVYMVGVIDKPMS